MAETIRVRAWLLGGVPIVVVVGVVVALLVGSSKKTAPRAGLAATEPPASAVPTIAPTVPLPPPRATPALPQPPPSSVPPIVAAAAASLLLAGPPPEPIPELDALARPPGSDQWTTEQKLAYRDKALQALDAKDQSLQQEIALARRRGDTQALQEKQQTLDYLRARRAEIDAALKKRDPLRDAPRNGGGGPAAGPAN